MTSQSEQVAANVAEARRLRDSGHSYREIRRQLALTQGQLGTIKRALKREKAGRTRLHKGNPHATERDLSVGASALPSGLRKQLVASGYRTLGDLADRIADRDRPGLETVPGIGPHRTRLVELLLDQFGLRAGSNELQAEIEALFPELRE
jgi:hypothetical protein